MGKAGYPSDVTDTEWSIIETAMKEVQPYKTGRPLETNLRDIWNALFYIDRTGCQWRYLPNDFPPPTTINYHYMKWVRNGTYQKVNDALRKRLRKEEGRNEEPSAGIIDSQSVKGTPESGHEASGVDGGKLVKGRKRHILVDTNGYVLEIVAHAANIADSVGGREVLKRAFERIKDIKLIWADGAYQGMVDWTLEKFFCVLEIVNKKENQKGFEILPRRWVVERSLGWLNRFRRLSKDYERKPASSEAMGYIGSIRLLLNRLGKFPQLFC
jgi:putative transposase